MKRRDIYYRNRRAVSEAPLLDPIAEAARQKSIEANRERIRREREQAREFSRIMEQELRDKHFPEM